MWKTILEWPQMEDQFDKEQLWSAVCGELGVSVSDGSFNVFIKPCAIWEIEPIDGERLLIQLACPSGYVSQNVDERYYGQIKKSLEGQTGKQVELAFVVKPELLQKQSKIQKAEVKVEAEDKVGLFETDNKWEADEREELVKLGLSHKFSFDNLVVGSANNLAYAAARAVVDSPGEKHNPLFIWGGVGVGKTHLMHAVGRSLRAKGYRNVRAITSEQFTNELISTIRNKRVGEFKDRYRNADALLIDDVQFFAGKDSSQEELFHTFNELFLKGKQIILTADRKPQDIDNIEQRLISRFLGGLTVDVGTPDYEMRLAILKQKCSEMMITAEDKALEMLADKVNTNSRELQGLLIRLANLADMKKQPLTCELVETETGIKAKKLEKKLRPQEVISLIAKMFDYKNKDLLGTSRKADLVRARHIAIFVLRKEMDMTLEKVAEMMGNRDHTTIMHAVDKIDKEFAINQLVREQVMRVKSALYK
ncbi:MAG: hypothetical protein ACD_40C00139G0004 [uncultured bacterium]|nr:MAG: hypothetical protein ACD_40C00139G0004 [uncultured bacterium]